MSGDGRRPALDRVNKHAGPKTFLISTSAFCNRGQRHAEHSVRRAFLFCVEPEIGVRCLRRYFSETSQLSNKAQNSLCLEPVGLGVPEGPAAVFP